MGQNNNGPTTVFRADVSQFKANIAEANAAIKKSNAEFEAASAGMDDWASTTEGLEAKLEQLASAIKENEKIEKAYKDQLKAVSETKQKNIKQAQSLRETLEKLKREGKENTDEYKKYQKQLTATEKAIDSNGKQERQLEVQVLKSTAAVKKTKAEYDKYDKKLKDVEEGTKDAAKETEDLGEELDELDDHAKKASDGFTVLKGVLANLASEAIIGGLKAIGGAVKSGVKAAIDAGKEAAAYADDILTMSTNTGLSTDTLQEYKAVAELVDVSLDTLTGSMAKNIKSMSNAAKGSKSYAEAYAKLGVAVTDANGNLRDGEDVYWDCIDSLGKISNETERDALAMQIFGKSAQDLNSLIAQGSGGFRELAKEAHEMGAVLSEEALQSLGAVDDAMQKWNTTSSATKNLFGAAMAPVMTEFYGGLTNIGKEFNGILNGVMNGEDVDTSGLLEAVDTMINNVSEKGSALFDLGGELLGKLGQGILNHLPEIAQKGSEILIGIVNGVVSALPNMTPTAIEILNTLLNAIISMLPALLECGVQILMGLIEGIIQALPSLLLAIVDMVIILVDALLDNIPVILDAAIQFFMAIADAIPVIIDKLVPKIPEIIITLVNVLLENIPVLLDAALELFMALVEAIPYILEILIPMIPDIVSAISDALIENFPVILDAAIQLLMALVEAIPVILEELIEMLPEIITTIIYALLDAIPKLLEAAGRMFGAIVAAIPGLLIDLSQGLWEMQKTLLKALTSIDLYDVGKDIILGLINGLGSAGREIWNAVKDIGNSIIRSFKDFFDIRSPSHLMEKLAGYLPEGAAVGIKKKASSAIDSMKVFANDLLDGFDTSSLSKKFDDIREGLSGSITVIKDDDDDDKPEGGGKGDNPNNPNVTYSPTFNYNKPLNAKETYRQNKNMLREIVGA